LKEKEKGRNERKFLNSQNSTGRKQHNEIAKLKTL
jgi:hypothetical protein